MTVRIRSEHSRTRGQSTIEFMLMVPIIFAIFFFIIEMSLYFSAVHYANYATFVVARCKEVGYGRGGNVKSAEDIAALVLTGSVFQNNYTLSNDSSMSSGALGVNVLSWKTSFPFLGPLIPDMPFSITVNLGPDELMYENLDNAPCTDNDIYSDPC